MKPFIAVFAFVLSALTQLSLGQQCGWYGLNAVTLYVHAEGSAEMIKGLNIYLIDEKNQPLTYEWTHYLKKRGDDRETLTDTLNFQINLPKDKKRSRSFNRKNYRYEGADTNYVTIINKIKKADKAPHPKLRVMIIDTDGEKNGGYFDTSIFELDYGKSIELCPNDFKDKRNGTRQTPHKNVAGGAYAPTEIVLIPKKDLRKGTLAFKDKNFEFYIKTDSLYDNSNRAQQARVDKIAIYKPRHIYSTQEIQNMPDYFSVKIHSELIDFGDFNFDGFADLRLLTDAYIDTTGHFREFYHYYLFDKSSEQFVTDTFLSHYHNIYFNRSNKTITRGVILNKEACTENHFLLLKNGEWVNHELLVSCADPKEPEIRLIYFYRWINGKWEGGLEGRID